MRWVRFCNPAIISGAPRYSLSASSISISRLCISFLKWLLFLLRIFAGKLFQITAPDLEKEIFCSSFKS